MALFAEQLAWLNSQDKAGKVRRETVSADMPPVKQAEYVIQLAYQANMPDSWHELQSWIQTTNAPVNAVEAELIMGFANAYRGGFNTFNRQDVPRPYFDKSKPRNEGSIRNALRNKNG